MFFYKVINLHYYLLVKKLKTAYFIPIYLLYIVQLTSRKNYQWSIYGIYYQAIDKKFYDS